MDNIFVKGDVVSLVPGAQYASGGAIQEKYHYMKLYIKELRKNGNYAIATTPNGSAIGTVDAKYLTVYTATKPVNGFESYLINTIADSIDVHKFANNTSSVTGKLGKYEIYTIVNEKDGYGQLKNGLGWIDLSLTERL